LRQVPQQLLRQMLQVQQRQMLWYLLHQGLWQLLRQTLEVQQRRCWQQQAHDLALPALLLHLLAAAAAALVAAALLQAALALLLALLWLPHAGWQVTLVAACHALSCHLHHHYQETCLTVMRQRLQPPCLQQVRRLAL
jgi:hypothetical protein